MHSIECQEHVTEENMSLLYTLVISFTRIAFLVDTPFGNLNCGKSMNKL